MSAAAEAERRISRLKREILSTREQLVESDNKYHRFFKANELLRKENERLVQLLHRFRGVEKLRTTVGIQTDNCSLSLASVVVKKERVATGVQTAECSHLSAPVVVKKERVATGVQTEKCSQLSAPVVAEKPRVTVGVQTEEWRPPSAPKVAEKTRVAVGVQTEVVVVPVVRMTTVVATSKVAVKPRLAVGVQTEQSGPPVVVEKKRVGVQTEKWILPSSSEESAEDDASDDDFYEQAWEMDAAESACKVIAPEFRRVGDLGDDGMPVWAVPKDKGQEQAAGSGLSIAEGLMAAANEVLQEQTGVVQEQETEAVQEQVTGIVQGEATGVIYHEESGLYYDYASGYYFDPERSLYYEPHSGVYYQYDYNAQEYKFHSQVDLSQHQEHQPQEKPQDKPQEKRKEKSKVTRKEKIEKMIEEKIEEKIREKIKGEAKRMEEIDDSGRTPTKVSVKKAHRRAAKKKQTSKETSAVPEKKKRKRGLKKHYAKLKRLKLEEKAATKSLKKRCKLGRELQAADVAESEEAGETQTAAQDHTSAVQGKNKSKFKRMRGKGKKRKSSTPDNSNSEPAKLPKETHEFDTNHTGPGEMCTFADDADDGQDDLEPGEIPADVEIPDSETACAELAGVVDSASTNADVCAESVSPWKTLSAKPTSKLSSTSTNPVPVHCVPCIRAMVTESNCVDLATLFVVTCDGGYIGRETGRNHVITIPDINISKVHAGFEYIETHNKYMLSDFASQNGTFLNGKRLSETKKMSTAFPLSHGDVIKVGETTLEMHIHTGLETCETCEPGQVRAELQAEKRLKGEEEFGVQKESMEQLRRNELKNIKKKFGLVNMSYTDNTEALNNPAYEDKSKERRRTKGSDNPYQPDDAPASVDRPIEGTNLGHKLLANMGWKEGKGLGLTEQGLSEPVQATIRVLPKAGLGADAALVSMDDVHSTKVKSQQAKTRERFEQVSGTAPKKEEKKKAGMTWVKGETMEPT